ncbi:MAG: RNA polymerase sigma factor [Clostridium sp.]
MTKTDWIFVQQAKKGDSHAFARLYEIYYKDLYHFALYYTKDSITAEDAVSSAVLKAFEQLHKLRKNDAFKSWLFQITANECKKLLKQKSIYLNDASWQEPAAAEDGYLTPEIQDELSQLSEPERRVITLSVFGGYTSKEIAGILKKREGSIRSIKSRALAKLREKNADL